MSGPRRKECRERRAFWRRRLQDDVRRALARPTGRAPGRGRPRRPSRHGRGRLRHGRTVRTRAVDARAGCRVHGRRPRGGSRRLPPAARSRRRCRRMSGGPRCRAGCWPACEPVPRRRQRGRARHLGFDGDVPRRGHDARGGDHLVDDFVEIHRQHPYGIGARIGARQREHVLDDPREPGRLLLDDLERSRYLPRRDAAAAGRRSAPFATLSPACAARERHPP